MARLLVVDDDAAIRTLLVTMLENEGHTVLEAADGPSALAQIDQGAPDLVVLDYMMPIWSGAEVCRRIREKCGLQLPVVFVSAAEDRSARLAAKEAGADEFLMKPIDRLELLTRVRTLLRLKQEVDRQKDRRRRLETELHQMEETLQRAERLASLGTMAGSVGHELKNLGMILFGVIDLVKEAYDEDRSPTTEDIRTLDRVSEQLVAHARNLETLSRPRPDAVERLDLRALMGPTLDALKRLGRLKHVKLELELPPEPVLVAVSRVRFEQVLTNLVVNGADAVKEAKRKKGGVRIGLKVEAGRAWVSVADDGCGIPDEARERIFDPYYTTKGPEVGTGLGLTIVRSLVAGFGGTLQLESAVGVGSTFRFDLPLSP